MRFGEFRPSNALESFLVVSFALLASVTAAHFQAFEHFCEWARGHEHFQADELLISAVIFCIAFFGLFMRRVSELRRLLVAADAARAAAICAANQDELTGIPNRRAFMQRAARVQRQDRNSVVMLLDLDGFKAVNDTWGHEAGDELLRYVAFQLHSLGEQSDDTFVARLGGDEFGIIIEHESGAIAESFARKVIESTSVCHFKQQNSSISASLGIAGHLSGATLNATLRRADEAMYQAKQSGGGCYRHA